MEGSTNECSLLTETGGEEEEEEQVEIGETWRS